MKLKISQFKQRLRGTGPRERSPFSRMARAVQPALVNGSAGLVFAPGGRLSRALSFTIANGTITQVEIIADPERLKQLELAILDDEGRSHGN